MSAVIEHLEDPEPILSNIYSALDKGGKIIITTPTKQAQTVLEMGSIIKIFDKEQNDDHKAYYDKSLLSNLLKQAGFSVLYYSTFEFGLNQIIVGEK